MVTVTHAKNVAIADDPKAAAAGEVLPSDWNADHVVTGVRTQLTADTTYNVSPAGSDLNGDGSVASPWATPQHAYNIVAGLDFQGHTVTIQIGDGTYTDAPLAPDGTTNASISFAASWIGGGLLIIQGNLTTTDNVVLDVSGTSGAGGFYFPNSLSGMVVINGGFHLKVSGGYLIHNFVPTVVGWNNNIHVTAVSNSDTLFEVSEGGIIFDGPIAPFATSITIEGNWSAIGGGSFGGTIQFAGTQFTLVGTPAWGDAAFGANDGTSIFVNSGIVTFTGAATGPVFDVEAGGMLDTNQGSLVPGGGFLPGDTAGELKGSVVFGNTAHHPNIGYAYQSTNFLTIDPNKSVATLVCADLPAASSNEGLMATVTDSTSAAWGTALSTTGGGTNRVLVRSNGTNYTVVGI